MAAIAPQPVIDAAQPWCCLPPGDLWFGVLAALIAVGEGDPMPTLAELNADIACLKCTVQSGDVPLLILGAIATLSGGGGLGTTQVYTGATPPAAPDDPTKPALWYPTGLGGIKQWDTV